MNELTIHLKNLPPHIQDFFDSAFVEVPKIMGRKPLEITNNLTLDINEMPEHTMRGDVMVGFFKLIMAVGYTEIHKRDQHEGK